ncbi:MAG TPA: endonuclease/exonuclease/phosphatase family protein [Acidimicrobiia bacterium]|nr:endonuclease/exonuclease/phosphatase family protein [Acidimicrobiia bacterium]
MTAAWEFPPRLDTRMTVMSWNLWWRFGPWAQRQPAIAATLTRLGPDIVCLQEVWEERDGPRQADQLAAGLGGYHVAHAAGLGVDLATESLGNAILSRWPIRDHEARPLPAPPGLDELRVVLRADIDGPRGPLEVFVTHLNWRMDQSDVRQDQIRAICEFVAETSDRRTYPPILTGDFNAEPDSDEIRLLTGLGAVPVPKLMFLDAWRTAGDGGPGYTWSNVNPFATLDCEPDRRLDYVFVGYPRAHGAGQVLAARIEGTQLVDGIYPSDHYAILAEVRY